MDNPAKEWLLSFRAKWEGANVGESIGTQTMDVMIQDIQNLLTTHSARLVKRLEDYRDGWLGKEEDGSDRVPEYDIVDQVIDIVEDI